MVEVHPSWHEAILPLRLTGHHFSKQIFWILTDLQHKCSIKNSGCVLLGPFGGNPVSDLILNQSVCILRAVVDLAKTNQVHDRIKDCQGATTGLPIS